MPLYQSGVRPRPPPDWRGSGGAGGGAGTELDARVHLVGPALGARRRSISCGQSTPCAKEPFALPLKGAEDAAFRSAIAGETKALVAAIKQAGGLKLDTEEADWLRRRTGGGDGFLRPGDLSTAYGRELCSKLALRAARQSATRYSDAPLDVPEDMSKVRACTEEGLALPTLSPARSTPHTTEDPARTFARPDPTQSTSQPLPWTVLAIAGDQLGADAAGRPCGTGLDPGATRSHARGKAPGRKGEEGEGSCSREGADRPAGGQLEGEEGAIGQGKAGRTSKEAAAQARRRGAGHAAEGEEGRGEMERQSALTLDFLFAREKPAKAQRRVRGDSGESLATPCADHQRGDRARRQ